MTLLILAVIWFITFVAWIFAFRLGLAWAQVKHVTLGRLLLAGGVVLAGTKVINLLFAMQLSKVGHWPIVQGISWHWIGDAILVLLFLVTTWVLISNLFGMSWKQTLTATLPTFVPVLFIFLMMKYVATSLLFGTYQVGACPMAPAIVGIHIRATCEQCGAPKYCTAPDARLGATFFASTRMICENNHVTTGCVDPEYPLAGDHILVSNLATPDRWDIVLFRNPSFPSDHFLSRVVGLPGETIHLQGGAVYVDGKQQELPSDLPGLAYVDHFDSEQGPNHFWGSTDRPVLLGEDEYFVLGDFSEDSYDSRFWQEAVPGHAPYALPRGNILGVVREIYWPPARWRSFP